MPGTNRSFHHVQVALAGITIVVAVVCLTFAEGHFLLHRHPADVAANKASGHSAMDTAHKQSPSPFSEQSYASPAGATGAITILEQSFGQFYPSGPPVNLGFGINAEFDGGAGQYTYWWREGKWKVMAMFYGNDSLGTQVVKNVVAYLHTHMLPAPENKGLIIIFEPGSSTGKTVLQNTIAWQFGSKVYKLQQAGDPVAALETVVNYSHGQCK